MTTTEFSQKIYKTDSKGKLRVLHVYTEGADLIQKSGLVDGAKVEHRSTCTGKNIGRSNETTPEQQAQAEAKSKIDTKMTTGYFNTMEEAQDTEVVLPMLAKSFEKESGKINWSLPVFAQPKLDGMRCFAVVKDSVVTLISRKGKSIDTCQHIIEDIKKIGIRNGILDGELYAHGKTFQENMKLIKKYREGETEDVCFTMYDTVEQIPYLDRLRVVNLIAGMNPDDSLKVIENVPVKTEADIKKCHSKFIGQGYEGTIVRHGEAGYVINKRTSFLLKYKDFIDIACKVIDVVPSEKKPEQGVVVCTNDGHTFNCGMKFSHKEREEILTNKDTYIGQTAEIRFFEYTDDGIPRFPVCHGFRLDK